MPGTATRSVLANRALAVEIIFFIGSIATRITTATTPLLLLKIDTISRLGAPLNLFQLLGVVNSHMEMNTRGRIITIDCDDG